MKKLFLSFALIMLVALSADAANILTVTILETTPEKTQDALIEVFTGKNFTIDEVNPYNVSFMKNFGDGFWTAARLNKIKCNIIPRDGNIKLMVSQIESINGVITRPRGIDHLVPLIAEVKHLLDGTPISAIANEAVDQLPGSGNERERQLGLTIGESGTITDVASDGAANGNIFIGDRLIEINGMTLADMDVAAIRSYIANKWGAGSSLVMLVEHEGEKKIITLKK